MIIKYRVVGDAFRSVQCMIDKVEVERETESSVWIRGRRNAKHSGWGIYYDSWNEAHQYLINKAESQLKAARVSLQQAQGVCGNIKGLKNPEDEKIHN